MKLHLVIIDAFNLIRRIHAVQATPCRPACLVALQKILRQHQPTHIVAIFDCSDPAKRWRNQLFAQYKSGRAAMPADLVAELPEIQASFQAAGVACWQSQQHEIFDIAATLVTKMAASGHRSTIVSTDQRYCQLLEPAIQIHDYFKKSWLDLSFIERQFAVRTSQLNYYWGFCGISNSKIPGLKGIGPQIAQQILHRYCNIEAVYADLDKLPTSVQVRLANNQQQAIICRQLATLQRDVQLDNNLKQLRFFSG